MNGKPTEDEVVAVLMKEIGMITGTETGLDPDRTLHENGINSMGFMELLLCVENRWHVSLIEKGITPKDIASVRAFAKTILEYAGEA